MRIGELARRAGTTTRALRFYESQGLLPAQRAANGYREYGEDDLRLVNEIQALRTVGLTLDDTRPFVECLRAGNERADVCPASLSAYRERIADIDSRMAELTGLRAQLADLLAQAESYRTQPAEERA